MSSFGARICLYNTNKEEKILNRRTFLYNALLLLPVLLLLGWWLGIQAYLRALPAPAWVLAARAGIRDDDLSGAALGNAQPVPDAPGVQVIPPRRAALIAWDMLSDHSGHSVTLNDGPRLMLVTFPDGKARLAWRAIALVAVDSSGLNAEAAAAYLDAVQGTPLAILEHIRVVDSDIAALAVPAESSIWVLILRNLPLILLGLYLMAVALLLLALSLIKRFTQPARAQAQPPAARR